MRPLIIVALLAVAGVASADGLVAPRARQASGLQSSAL